MFKKSFLVFLFVLSSSAFSEEKKPIECSSAKEFITTFNFLKDKKEFGVEEKKAIELSKFVANGCSGAANRFIQTMVTLTDAEVPANEALISAKSLSQESDAVFNSFIAVFKKVYVEKYFDLSSKKSLQIASDLTVNMEKDANKVAEDFSALGDFCMNHNGLELGYEKCANFISTVIVKSKKHNTNIAKPTIEFFDYLVREDKGPKLSALKAMEEIESIAEFGANGYANFNQAYAFATSEKGLNLPNAQALKLAKEVASQAIKK